MSTQYQSFSEIRGASDSLKKLLKLGIPDLKDKKFLDVGCNEGYFCGYASAAGARFTLGIDSDLKSIERAKNRFSSLKFIHQTWDDGIEGKFDVILFASAIHYAKDQLSTLKKILNCLSNNGVLILELGLLEESEIKSTDGYELIERSPGDFKKYTSANYLIENLSEYVIRCVGKSVNQSGDSVDRYVLHIFKRKKILLFVNGPSYSGKSIFSSSLKDVNLISFDQILHDFPLSRTPYTFNPIFDLILECKDKPQQEAILAVYKNNLLDLFLEYIFHHYFSNDFLFCVFELSLKKRGFLLKQIKEYFKAKDFILWEATRINDTHPQEVYPLPDKNLVTFENKTYFKSRNIKVFWDKWHNIDHRICISGWIKNKDPKNKPSLKAIRINNLNPHLSCHIDFYERTDVISIIDSGVENHIGFNIYIDKIAYPKIDSLSLFIQDSNYSFDIFYAPISFLIPNED